MHRCFVPTQQLDASLAVEVERQWLAPKGVRLPARIGAWTMVDEHGANMIDRYFDTTLLCLADRRARLRVRSSAHEDIATLKRRLPGSAGERRKLELQAPAGDDPQASAPFLAAGLITDAPLREIGAIRTRRLTRIYRRDKLAVEVVRDHVGYKWGATIWRVEAEGPEAAVRAFAADIEAAVPGLRPARQGKVATLFERHRAAA